jgi:hypothetical protein
MRSDKDVAFLAEKLAQDIRKVVDGMVHLVNKAARPDTQLQQCELVPSTAKLNALGVQSNEQTFWRWATFDFVDVLRHYSRVASDGGLDARVPLLEEFNLVHRSWGRSLLLRKSWTDDSRAPFVPLPAAAISNVGWINGLPRVHGDTLATLQSQSKKTKFRIFNLVTNPRLETHCTLKD